MSDVSDLTRDHVGLADTWAARRYFEKFERINGYLARVAAAMATDRVLSKTDVKVLGRYLEALNGTFQALSHKYLLTGRDTGTFFGSLTVDVHESGFPVFEELMTMASDAPQAARHLAGMPGIEELKNEMVRSIVGDLEIPTKLQFALSQRLYYEALTNSGLFWVRNDPVAIWLGNAGDSAARNRYMVHWAVYDSQVNLPVIYLLELEDSGNHALPKDQWRWPRVQQHLMAQSIAGLKLVTIAQGFDSDFDDLHPKRLRRLRLGPMYSSAFTQQSGPISQVLEEARAPKGQDWALAWTTEELVSERVEWEKTGWFGKAEREIFALDPFSARGAETGATATERSIILPERQYQVLAEKNPPGFGSVRKYVVSGGGRVFAYR
ncbi:hypothetical protein CLV78_10640 [Aliiruegeria haliotis]|uniref:Uncharacterized protein n=1 Tax=Aliiruegeria haliotis TaxID=1280846 RepID=A0A2T0RN01_9RHOB|nr:hypothetical protein [Aliiruegeria haliotis]PRY22500.1 hypothetical protein CLV78_10640 [Aliiruegeria haliotis]